jgi:hypothetical protein
MGKAMKTKIVLFIAALTVLNFNPPSFCSDSQSEPFDRIVLNDMTVIKASLVKDLGDSLAYFELNDTEFVKHTIGRDQVFKWVRAVPKTVSSDKITLPASDSVNIERTRAITPQNKPQTIINDSLKNDIPVVDYQTAILNAVKDSEIIQSPAALNTPINDLQKNETKNSINESQGDTHQAGAFSKADDKPKPVPAYSVTEYDTGNSVPSGLSRVRLDLPTKTDGVKIIPRSGMLAINPSISLGSVGLGLRNWSASGFGFGAKGEWLWGSESGFLVNGELMQALNSKGRCRWYGFGKIGYEWVTMTTPAMSVSGVNIPGTSTNFSFVNFVLGIGLEWRTGINRNHGWAVELGYQYGQTDYSYTQPGYTIGTLTIEAQKVNSSYTLSPVYMGFSYSYYF